jgi:3-phosphoshikimate 1-carboxyvinyltransferase
LTQLRANPSSGLRGAARVPGDKSISHRALILAALAAGDSRISGLLESEDVLANAGALRALGAHVERLDGGDNAWRVAGLGIGGLFEPDRVLDLGNSGTAVRLLMGVVAGHDFTAHMSGDDSLRQRPMDRVAAPLRQMGARIEGRDGDRLPLSVTGTEPLVPIEYELPVASAQVKSAVLFAGLAAPGETTVVESLPTRDHTERLLPRFGAEVRVEKSGAGHRITVVGEPELVPAVVLVPGDASSAAYPVVAALLTRDSQVRIESVGINPLRRGLFDTLVEMGADLVFENERDVDGEPVADIVARSSELRGVEVSAERAPAMIDEYPVLAVAAAAATGPTRMAGVGELRVKESDRLAAIIAGLGASGVEARAEGEALVVEGTGGAIPGGGSVTASFDHRIAMAFLVLGLAARAPVTVDGTESIDSSYPGFAGQMSDLGADITPAS